MGQTTTLVVDRRATGDDTAASRWRPVISDRLIGSHWTRNNGDRHDAAYNGHARHHACAAPPLHVFCSTGLINRPVAIDFADAIKTFRELHNIVGRSL